MSFDVVVNDLRRMYPEPAAGEEPHPTHLTDADLDRWSTSLGCTRAALYDQISIYLAQGYHDSKLTFYFCDSIINRIQGIITSSDEIRSNTFWEVFLAFDAGEYYHDGDNRDSDPAELYTRPRIGKFIEEQSLS